MTDDDKAIPNERNIIADDATSEQVIASTLQLALPILRDIAASLAAINKAIAPDENGRSVVAELRMILTALGELVKGERL